MPAPRLTKPPRLLAPVEPTFPPEAAAQGLAADVTLQIDIDAEGQVTGVVVTKPAGHGFDEAATEAALRMEFEPAEIDGKPGAIRIEYVMRFRPKPPPAATPTPTPAPEPTPPPPPTTVLLRGRLREKGTRDPIGGADVSLLRIEGRASAAAADVPTLVGATDADGRFSVEGSEGGRVRLLIASGEHEPCIRDLDLPPPGAPPIEILCTVARSRGPSYETVVSAPREGEEITRHSISQPEMTTVPGTFGDPLRVIQNLPGIARAPYGLGLLIIRGSSPQDSGIYVDGHRVPLLYHFLGGPSVLAPDLLERIDFFPGGFGVRYGRATAGVIDVATRTDAPRRVHGSADVDFLDSSASIEGPLGGGFAGALAARRSYIDALLPFVLGQSEGSSAAVVTPVYWDYQARVTRALGRAGRVSLFAFGSDDSLAVVARDPTRGDIDLGTRIGFHRVIATHTATLGAWTSRLSPSYGYQHVRFSAGEVGGSGSAHVLTLREDLSRPLTPRLKFAAGLDAELAIGAFEADVPLPPGRRTYGRTANVNMRLARSNQMLGAGLYAEALWDPHPTLRIVPGVRADWFHLGHTDRASADPRLVVRWQATAAQAFKVGAGIFHQAPLPPEVDAEFGNPDLPLLWADQYHAGIEQSFGRVLSLDATAYFMRRHNLPVGSARQVDGRFERYASAGRGRAYGLEMRLKHAVTEKFYGWISYTLSRAEVVLRLPEPGTTPSYRPTDFDQTHNLIFVASRRLGAWELGTRFRLVTGIPETPIHGATYDADYNMYDPARGPIGSERRPLFHQLDLRIERTFTFEAWRLSAYVDVQNVYNAENPEATLYDYRYRHQAPVRGLPILPVLGIRGRF